MRANVIIDDRLINEGLELTKLRTKTELIKTALLELIENRKKKDLRKIKGKINFRDDYNYKEMRK
jgi:flagellar basal body-associated protein FliL